MSRVVDDAAHILIVLPVKTWFLLSCWKQIAQKQKTDLDGVGVLSNATVICSDRLSSCVDLLGVDSILGVQVLDLSVGEDPASNCIQCDGQPGQRNCAIPVEKNEHCSAERKMLMGRAYCRTCKRFEDSCLLQNRTVSQQQFL